MEQPDPSTTSKSKMRSRKRVPLPNFDRPIETNSYRKRHCQISPQNDINNKKDTPVVDTKKVPPTPQQQRKSRIAGVLPYQRFRQHWDPSSPMTNANTQYTRRELRIMNDETPDRGEEESPLFHKLTQDKTEITSSSSDFHQQQQHPECHVSQPLSPSQPKEGSGHPEISATQKFLDHDGQFAVSASSTYIEPSGNTDQHSEPSQPDGDITTAISPLKEAPPCPTDDSTFTARNNGAPDSQNCNAKEDSQNDIKDRYDSMSGKRSSQTTEQQQSLDHVTPATAHQEQYRLFFVERGRDMHTDILVGPKMNARARGAKVLEQFDRHAKDPLAIPTHLVVGNVSSPDIVSRALGFQSVEELRYYMHEHNIQCATRAWATKISTEPYQQPRRAFILQQLGVPYLEIYNPLTPLAPPRPTVTRAKPTKYFNSEVVRQTQQPPAHNVALSKIFRRLAKAYQEAPLDAIDPWRAYSFTTAASRLRALPFEVDDHHALERVKSIKGFGSSIIAILQEYVEQKEGGDEEEVADDTNEHSITIRRLENVKSDPQREILRTMMNIWGVGRAKALEIVKAGYTTIEEIRNDFDRNCLRVSLNRNQYIGLLCYEDIMEEMDRSEVEQIRDIIQKAIHEVYPQAEVEIMGSYRRGKESCGDIDILIVHPKYQKKVNPKALGRIVDSLRVRGHMAYNLTQLPGMDTEAFETLPRDVAKRLGRPNILQPKREKDACSSYMGIFNSPVHPGKLRRCDLKWYPYRERFFASLYFTGNGFFNRSMRLWAKRKFGYTLSDHGLFQDSSGKVRVFDALSEALIFRRLGLVWKEPTEREGFDDVIGVDSKRATDLNAWSSDEFRREERDHVWIN